MTAILDVQSITRRFGDFTAVDEVSFQVGPGQIIGFIGPNGAGKTTTMRICATLELPDEGDVLVNGMSVLESPREVRRRLGFMPDAYGSYPATTVRDYLDFFARAYGLKGSHRRSTLAELIEFTGLEGMVEKEMSGLSKGMRQRLCLAKTLLHDPSLLILDEPAAGLDPRARVELRELVLALARMGKGILISSHILAELTEVCDGVAVIEAGKIRAYGPLDEIKRLARSKAEVRVRALVGAETTRLFLAQQGGLEVTREDGEAVHFEFDGGEQELAALVQRMVQSGLQPVEIGYHETNLEDLFLQLTEGTVS